MAKSIIRQSEQAAETLAAQGDVRSTYNPHLHGAYDAPRLGPAVQQEIELIYDAAHNANQSNEE